MQKRFLLLLLLLLIIPFLTFKFTGYSITNSGDISVTVLPMAAIDFKINEIDFGSGKVNSGEMNATIDTKGNVSRGSWIPTFGGFTIENIGNINLSLTLKSTKTASEFIGGTGPGYFFSIDNIEDNSCTSGLVFGQWYEVNTTYPGTAICNNFNSEELNNSISVDLRLVIPHDSRLGFQNDTFTAIGTGI